MWLKSDGKQLGFGMSDVLDYSEMIGNAADYGRLYSQLAEYIVSDTQKSTYKAKNFKVPFFNAFISHFVIFILLF